MIGDTPWDVDAAGRVGVRTIAVRTGGFAAAELEDAGAAAVFESVVELSRKLDQTTPCAKARAAQASRREGLKRRRLRVPLQQIDNGALDPCSHAIVRDIECGHPLERLRDRSSPKVTIERARIDVRPSGHCRRVAEELATDRTASLIARLRAVFECASRPSVASVTAAITVAFQVLNCLALTSSPRWSFR